MSKPWLVICVALLANTALAEERWEQPFPGLGYLKRTESGRLYHLVKVRLSHPHLALRATAPDERGRSTLDFAKLVDAAVALSGDSLSTPGLPRGLAVGDGKPWPAPRAGAAGRAFLACDAGKGCRIEAPAGALRPEWTNVIGGEGALLVRDGTARTAEEDASCGDACTSARPRAALGLDKARATLFLLVSDGAARFEVAAQLRGLGAHRALQLDGPSAALVIGGKQVNRAARRAPVAANHLAVLYRPPPDGCSVAKRIACETFGCACVAEQCNGGACPGDGCTAELRARCARFGCTCVDMQCNGGFCPGPGCALGAILDCQRKGCGCVDGRCAGGRCAGPGCTAMQIGDCARFGCACAGGKCSGGFCAGSGCEAVQEAECAKFGCGCVDGKCAGGYCAGTGCTAKQTAECATFRCGCVDGACNGENCPGTGCTAKMIADCTLRGCGCANGRCEGGKCSERGCGCRVAAARNDGLEPLPLLVIPLLLASLLLRAPRRGRPRAQ